MKRLLIVSAIIGLFGAGCKEPAPVQLEDDPDAFEASALEQADPSLDLKAIDTTGITPKDQERITGYLLVNELKYDDGGPVVRRFAYSSALFGDRSRPVQILTHIFGYFGVPVRSLTLNGAPMVVRPHIVRLRGLQRDTVAGFEYVQDLTATYQPNQRYTWGIQPFLGDSLAIPIQSPEELIVYSPAGGSIVSRDRALLVRWRGRGNLTIIVSAVNPFSDKPIPFLSLSPRVNREFGIVPVKVLSSMRPGTYLFTFILWNRYKIPSVALGSAEILVQAASVYTTRFALQ